MVIYVFISGSLRLRSMVIPDSYIEAGPQRDQYNIAQLNSPHIQAKVESLLGGLREHRRSQGLVNIV